MRVIFIVAMIFVSSVASADAKTGLIETIIDALKAGHSAIVNEQLAIAQLRGARTRFSAHALVDSGYLLAAPGAHPKTNVVIKVLQGGRLEGAVPTWLRRTELVAKDTKMGRVEVGIVTPASKVEKAIISELVEKHGESAILSNYDPKIRAVIETNLSTFGQRHEVDLLRNAVESVGIHPSDLAIGNIRAVKFGSGDYGVVHSIVIDAENLSANQLRALVEFAAEI